ncbi:thioredoxin family protein [Vagococcus sp. BWB3-3]|uniref:Thioredoxin family protein n=1 Tax=Vagococcus allomyrinae TaxID=2794353 RepID=A0A940P1S5_9ENTE|nr:thioredoxin family protein [Vagococcus allomyrinae]MBP1039470.1 thioredoxin family protein [Vagococcus allomyrinae]
MKKIIIIIAFAAFILGGCSKQTSSPTETTGTDITVTSSTSDAAVLAYEKEVKGLTELSLDDLKTKLAEPTAFLIYLGKPTCEYCQAFVPKLTASLKEQPQTVYYFDVTEADTNLEIKELLASLELEYVPAFLRISNSGKTIETFDKKNGELSAFLKS